MAATGQRGVGTAVFGGMLVASTLGIFLIPMLSMPGGRSRAAQPARTRTERSEPLVRSLAELNAVRLRLFSDTEEEHLWNAQVEHYYPLGYKKPFGYSDCIQWRDRGHDGGRGRTGAMSTRQTY